MIIKHPKLPFRNKYLLAPMEEINDAAFRMLCLKAGAGGVWTGMTHPQMQKEIELEDKPILQLFCINEKGIPEFIKKYDSKVSGWDFNLGCPAKNARRHGFGSYFTDLKKIEDVLKTIRKSTKKPIGVKFRKNEISFDILKIAEKYCDFICIHPRTQKQGYSGKADVEFAKEIKKNTKLPVIYSGDIANKKQADELLKTFDYAMIGRAAIGNPNIFYELNDKKAWKEITFLDYFKLIEKKKYHFPFKQILLQALNFTKGMKRASEYRNKIARMKSEREIKEFYKRLRLLR